MRLVFLALFFAGAFPAVAEDASPPRLGDAHSYGLDTGNLHYADLLQATGQYDAVFVWEGLPREYGNTPPAEKPAPGKTFKIGDQEFYSRPLGLTAEETAAVSDAVLKHKENFNPWSGVKFCGGFHANYAIEWRRKGVVLAQVLLCFTCCEARFLVGDRSELVDQSASGISRFRSLLSSHHQERLVKPADVLHPPPPAAPILDLPPPPAQSPK